MVSTTKLFNVRESHYESIKEYISKFNEDTIKGGQS